MSTHNAGQARSTATRPSLFDLVKVVLRLGPKQINDEIQLAIGQMKTKGVAAGIAAALMVVGLVFVAFLVVALIVAAVAAFALIFELWAAALIVAGIFLVIALIFVLIGLSRLKKALPLIPEDAIRGLRMDLGVAKEGSSFDPNSLDQQDEERRRQKAEAKRQQAEQKKKDSKEPGSGSPRVPSYREIIRRAALRRDHIASLQDQIVARANKDALRDEAQDAFQDLKGKAVSALKGSPASTPRPTPAGERDADQNPAAAHVAARWKPLAVLGASAAAGAVFLRELTKK